MVARSRGCEFEGSYELWPTSFDDHAIAEHALWEVAEWCGYEDDYVVKLGELRSKIFPKEPGK
jgi:hypothetical protein